MQNGYTPNIFKSPPKSNYTPISNEVLTLPDYFEEFDSMALWAYLRLWNAPTNFHFSTKTAKTLWKVSGPTTITKYRTLLHDFGLFRHYQSQMFGKTYNWVFKHTLTGFIYDTLLSLYKDVLKHSENCYKELINQLDNDCNLWSRIDSDKKLNKFINVLVQNHIEIINSYLKDDEDFCKDMLKNNIYLIYFIYNKLQENDSCFTVTCNAQNDSCFTVQCITGDCKSCKYTILYKYIYNHIFFNISKDILKMQKSKFLHDYLLKNLNTSYTNTLPLVKIHVLDHEHKEYTSEYYQSILADLNSNLYSASLTFFNNIDKEENQVNIKETEMKVNFNDLKIKKIDLTPASTQENIIESTMTNKQLKDKKNFPGKSKNKLDNKETVDLDAVVHTKMGDLTEGQNRIANMMRKENAENERLKQEERIQARNNATIKMNKNTAREFFPNDKEILALLDEYVEGTFDMFRKKMQFNHVLKDLIATIPDRKDQIASIKTAIKKGYGAFYPPYDAKPSKQQYPGKVSSEVKSIDNNLQSFLDNLSGGNQ